MIGFVNGILVVVALWMLFVYSKKKGIDFSWWHWTLITTTLLYFVFTIAVVLKFLEEDVAQGALLMSILMGVPGVIGAILVWRFVLNKKGGAVQMEAIDGAE